MCFPRLSFRLSTYIYHSVLIFHTLPQHFQALSDFKPCTRTYQTFKYLGSELLKIWPDSRFSSFLGRLCVPPWPPYQPRSTELIHVLPTKSKLLAASRVSAPTWTSPLLSTSPGSTTQQKNIGRDRTRGSLPPSWILSVVRIPCPSPAGSTISTRPALALGSRVSRKSLLQPTKITGISRRRNGPQTPRFPCRPSSPSTR